MKIHRIIIAAGLCLAFGCAGSHPPPTQQMADVQSANRGATELGAHKNPRAELHLKLAEEQLDLARKAVANDDNERATSLLMRAKADAELAVALTREDNAKVQEAKANEQADSKQTPLGGAQ
jgi:Spy/CpxP family protein refolding chaperone